MAGSLRPSGDPQKLRLPARARRGLLLLALAAAAIVAMPAQGASAATVPTGMLGMNDWTSPSDQMLANVSHAGVHRWRAAMFWYLVEKQQGQRNWGDYDRLVASSARNNVSLLFVMASCPAWACSELSGPPTSPSGLAAERDFLRAAILRYGSHGSFWAAHPELPPKPVSDWQVWNEVNSKEFWKPYPNAADYARFLGQNAAVIRAADPAAKVVASGLTEYGQVSIHDYMEQLYAQPGFRSSFDVLALHAYAPDVPNMVKLLDRARGVMTEHGDGGHQIWITEMGWGTSTPSLPTPTSESQQAELLRDSFDTLVGCRSRWNLGRAYWFAYNDFKPGPGEADYAGNHTGLFDLSGRAKPSWNVLKQFHEGAARPLSGCEEGGSALAASSKTPNTRIKIRRRAKRTRRARARLVATASGARFDCRLARTRIKRNGHVSRRHGRWRRCRSHYRSPKLRVGYRYRLLVRAHTAAGVDHSPASVKLRLRRTRSGRLVLRAARRAAR